ncbi:MAG: hypothetical protein U0521_11485 [Anaerolineae bacterium]
MLTTTPTYRALATRCPARDALSAFRTVSTASSAPMAVTAFSFALAQQRRNIHDHADRNRAQSDYR